MHTFYYSTSYRKSKHKLHKRPYKARFIVNSSSCTTTSLSKVLTSCLTAIKNHWIKYCEKTYERELKNTFRREEALYLAYNEERAFFASEEHKKYDLWSCQKVTNALIYLLDNIYIRFGSKLYRQNVGIPMGLNCAPLVADLFLFCCERDFMKSLTKEKRYDLIDAFNSTSRYLDDLLNIDNIHFEHMVHRIYPAELQLNKANASDTEGAFLDLNLSIHNDIYFSLVFHELCVFPQQWKRHLSLQPYWRYNPCAFFLFFF